MEGYEQIIRCLQESFNPLFSRQVEKALEREESRKGFVNDILRIVSLDRLDMPTRQAACVLFKNFIRKNWGVYGINALYFCNILREKGVLLKLKKENG